MSARDEILARVRAARGKDAPAPRPPAVIPARAKGSERELFARFCEMAKRAGATLAAVPDARELGREIARFLGQEGLPRAVRMAGDPGLDFIALLKPAGFSVSRGPAQPADRVGLSRALAGVAETGSLMFASGPGQAMSLALLPEVHIAVLARARIAGSYEQAMAPFRGNDGAHELPRAVTFLTGPSRSADIEQKIQFGAHGPRRLHIVILENAP